MSHNNPFVGILAPVTGHQFVGRNHELKLLRDNTHKGFVTNVVGLPRFGKTSLVMQCFTEDHAFNKWVDEDHYAPIYCEVPEENDLVYLWFAMRSAIKDFLRRRKEKPQYLDNTHNLSEGEEIYQNIKLETDEIFTRTGLHLLFILDEFDRVLRMKNGASVFSKIQSLTLHLPVVICSRRTYSFIEKSLKKDDYDPGKSPLEIFVGLFERKEIKEYWEHFKDCFSSFPPEEFKKYQELVYVYTGGHPLLMNRMNLTLLQKEVAPYETWTMDNEKIKLEIRQHVESEFLSQLPYVEEQKLLDTAIQLILGTSHKVPSDDLDRVLKYGFVRTVPSKEKKAMFGYNFGPYTKDTLQQYICVSALTTHLMKDKYDPDIQGFELIKQTEINLRSVIAEYLRELCEDQNPFETEMVSIDGFERPCEHERWEKRLYDCTPRFLKNRADSDAFLDNTDEMYRRKQTRKSLDTKPTLEPFRINMLTSASLGNLWFVFMKWHWIDFFFEVFDPEHLLFHRNGNEWYDKVFSHVLNWRNEIDHNNVEELTDRAIEKASNLAREINRCIDRWFNMRNRMQ